jgi:hypothetical protein
MCDLRNELRRLAAVILLLLSFDTVASQATADEMLISPPEHGFVSRLPASKWEESMITGNGTIGALVFGDPLNERIILSHEKLFLPEYPPTAPPPLHKYLERIWELTSNGRGEEAAELVGPVASIRLKNLRDGMEDYEYFALLDERADSAAVDEIVLSIVPTWGTWNQDPYRLPELRKRLAAAILRH